MHNLVNETQQLFSAVYNNVEVLCLDPILSSYDENPEILNRILA